MSEQSIWLAQTSIADKCYSRVISVQTLGEHPKEVSSYWLDPPDPAELSSKDHMDMVPLSKPLWCQQWSYWKAGRKYSKRGKQWPAWPSSSSLNCQSSLSE